MDFDRLVALFRALEKHDVDYVVVGGVALNMHGIVRATEDVDLFVRPGEANIAQLKAALHAVWDDPHIEEISAADLSGEYPVIRYGPPGVAFVIDVISRLGSTIVMDDLEWQEVEFEGAKVRLVTPSSLFEMKKDTIRPIDRADAQELRDKFGLGTDGG